jgi:NitT/TauT family transport system permease protein
MLQPKLEARSFWTLTIAGVVALFGVWSVAALSGITSRTFLPAPWDVLARLARLTVEPFVGHVLHEHLLSSLQRYLLGFVLAVVVGIPLGLAMAWFRWVDRLILPLFETVRFIAPIAWVPFAALWFGTGIGGPTLIIFMGAFPPVLINTYRGATQVDRKYIEAAQTLGAGSLRTITQVLLPASVPSIVAGLRISAGLGWQSLVGAELIVASSGIGYLMVKGQASVSTTTVMSGMIAVGAIGFLIDVLLRRAQLAIEARRGT